jgi:ABC-2 type transport system permease protein
MAALSGALAAVARALAPAGVFVGELFRQPGLLLIVICGPFLILLVFVLGARVYRDFPTTILVQPAGTSEPSGAPGPAELSNYLRVVEVTSSRERALARLQRGEVQLVVELPAEPQAALARGEQAQIRLYTNEIDPLTRSFFTLYVESQLAELNRQAVARAAAQAQRSVAELQGDLARLQRALEGVDPQQVAELRARIAEARRLLAQLDSTVAQAAATAAGTGVALPELAAQQARWRQLDADLARLDAQLALVPSAEELARLRQVAAQVQPVLARLQGTSPDVLSAPFAGMVIDTAPYLPAGTLYFLPGILVLVLQHLAVTLAAVSIARDRRLGILDLYRLAPAAPSEILLGKYVGLVVMVALVAAAVTALALGALGLPVLGGLAWLAVVLGAFLLTALALGIVVGLVTPSEATAIQVAMLLLIASVAFGGLLAPLDQLALPLRVAAFGLPVTAGKVLLEAVLFRGYLYDWATPTVLGALLVVLLALSFRLFGRQLAQRAG